MARSPNKKTVENKPLKHPANNEAAADDLYNYVFSRLQFFHEFRREQICARYEFIDRQIAGYLDLSVDDKKRREEQRKGKSLKPTDVNLPLVFTQLDDASTFLMSVFSPSSGMFEGVGSGAEEQKVTNAFVELMNRNAEDMQYYRQLAKASFGALKYNLGAMEVVWKEVKGKKPINKEDQTMQISDLETLWAGNELKALDVYNFMYDVSVNPVDLPTKGEWFAYVEPWTRFQLERMNDADSIYNLDKLSNDGIGSNARYLQCPPETRYDFAVEEEGRPKNWVTFLEGIAGNENRYMTGWHEIVTWTGWIRPKDFNLGNSNDLTIYRLIFAIEGESAVLIYDEAFNNAHELLPICCTVPIETELGMDQKSYGENLIPFQIFSSFLMNVHQRSMRKALFGLRVYDPSMVDLSMIGDDVAGNIPIKTGFYNKTIKDVMAVYNDVPRTENTLDQIGEINNIMQFILPSDQRGNVADIDRATTYQAAAAVQGGNKRSYKIATMMAMQMLKPMKNIMHYNVLQYQQAVEIIGSDGKKVEVDPAKFRDANIRYNIGSGLKGLDRLMIVTIMKDILMTAIQNREAMQELDIIKMMNYVSTLAGEDTDIEQFRRQQPEQPPQPQQQLPQGGPTQ
jgi:hypothetical protein